MVSDLKLTRRAAVLATAATAALLGAPISAETIGAQNVDDTGLMLRGYDPVAYFTLGAATPGSPAITAEHAGATYRFASTEHRDRFLADPAAYAPAYGGYCALGTAMGRKFDGDPEVWAIVDDRLYVNIHEDAQRRWEPEADGFIRTANHNWRLIRERDDRDLEASPPAGLRMGPS